MPILCFGGSFNPIHNGHLLCAQSVASCAGYDQVLLIPNAHPPHKPDTPDLAPASDRLAMCHLAAAFMRRDGVTFDVSNIETRRGGPSYTIDTAQELQAAGFALPIYWLIGADMLMYLPKWHRVEDLLTMVHFVIMARPGWTIDFSKLPKTFQHLQGQIVPAPTVDISATDIRRRVKVGEPIHDLVPPRVAEYIATHRLYV